MCVRARVRACVCVWGGGGVCERKRDSVYCVICSILQPRVKQVCAVYPVPCSNYASALPGSGVTISCVREAISLVINFYIIMCA